MSELLLNPWVLLGLKIAVGLGLVMTMVPVLIWMERKVSARFQLRLGPNRIGPFGLFQNIADAVKLIWKEDFFPRNTDRILFLAAPIMTFMPGMLIFALIPVGFTGNPALGFGGVLAISDIGLGVLVALAISSVSSYGLAFAGWSSNNQYSLLGGIRSSAQLISYEIVLGLSIIAFLMMTGSINFIEIVFQQQATWWNIARQPLTFFLFLVAAFAELNRAPFDLPEAEQELVGGYHIEYTGLRYAWFMFGEYAALFTMCSIITTLFLGGWSLPFVDTWLMATPWWFMGLASFGIFMTKVFALVFFFMWVRWTMPRFRWDQLMNLGWTTLIPLALANILLMAVLMEFGGFYVD